MSSVNNQCAVSVKAFNQTSQTVLSNGSPVLLNQEITGGKCSGITINNSSITLCKPGTYFVSVNANALATAAGDLTLELLNKGVAIPSAIASVTADTTATENLSFSTLITVDCSCNCINNNVVLTLLNTGVEATYSNIQITIFKI